MTTLTPNADLLAFADTIVALEAEGILAATIAEMRKPKAVAKPKAKKAAPKAAKTGDFWSGPASDGQIKRFNRLETALNAHFGDDCALSVKGDFTNAKDCSEQYAELAKLGKKLNLNWAA